MADLKLLKPKVKKMAEELIKKCGENGIKIIITHTLRTKEKQDELYAQGRTKPGRIVTNAKGGYSFHNHGVAFDCKPNINQKVSSNDYLKLFNTIGEIGESLGLEWGGR